jgi:endonuclease/exonuclease/phosphatase family metal-dependent hydrolase
MNLVVLTWNVEYAAGAERNARRAQLLLETNADIVVLTETHDELSLPGYRAESTLQRERRREGARWTTIWSRLEVRHRIGTADPRRTVAVELEGDVIVYGTVLPWHTDNGPSGDKSANWAEFRRVVPIQGAEWRSLREQHPGHILIVAGDLNQSLGDRHYYGGRELRQLVEDQCSAADLQVLTGLAHQQVPLAHPVIDHIALAPPAGSSARTQRLIGWEGGWEGPGRLSDHSAVGVSVEVTRQDLHAASKTACADRGTSAAAPKRAAGGLGSAKKDAVPRALEEGLAMAVDDEPCLVRTHRYRDLHGVVVRLLVVPEIDGLTGLQGGPIEDLGTPMWHGLLPRAAVMPPKAQ